MNDDSINDHSIIRRSLVFVIVSSIIESSFIGEAHAGAWTQPQGRAQLIVTGLSYRADSRFDATGHSTHQPRYAKDEINPYVEYGLADGLTVGGSTFLQRLDDSTDSTSGLGDTEIFARWRLFQNDRYALALQPEIKLPSPLGGSSRTPAIGSPHIDGGVRAISGLNFEAFGRRHFAEATAAYRYRTGNPEDQIFASATLGLRVSDQWTVMPQIFQTWRVRTPAAASFTQSPRDDYSLAKLQLSGVYAFSDTQSVQAGAFRHVAGRNTARGSGALISWWQGF